MRRPLIVLACLLSPTVCWADWAVTGIRLECLQSLGQFRFSAETVSPAEMEVTAPKEATSRFLAQARKEGLFVEGKHTYRCTINGVVVAARVAIDAPSESGECGANPGGRVNVTTNGKEVLNVQFGNYCFPSAWRGGITIPGKYASPHESAGLTVCGYGRFQSNGDKKPRCTTVPLASGTDSAFGTAQLETLLNDR